MRRKSPFVLMAALVMSGAVVAQEQQRIPSPRGQAATQILGEYQEVDGRQQYTGGQWIEIDYGRPIKRDRTLFGSGADYATQLYAGAPIWRGGANSSTRFRTETPLVFGAHTLPAGEYSMFIDLAGPNDWTLVFSRLAAQPQPRQGEGIWGAYGYTADQDVFRAPMTVSQLPFSVDQLTWSFLDVSATGGTLAIMWDTTMGAIDFTAAEAGS